MLRPRSMNYPAAMLNLCPSLTRPSGLRLPVRLVVDAQPGSYAVVVGKQARDLGDLHDRRLGAAGLAERGDVARDNGLGTPREFRSVFCQRTRPLREAFERRCAPVRRDGIDEFVVSDLVPEVVCMRANSVVALVLGGNHHGQHLALRARQVAGSLHDGKIQTHGVA